jgi:hypothetical protein
MARGARDLPMPRTTIVRAQERHCQRRSPVKSEDIQNGEVLHVTEAEVTRVPRAHVPVLSRYFTLFSCIR